VHTKIYILPCLHSSFKINTSLIQTTGTHPPGNSPHSFWTSKADSMLSKYRALWSRPRTHYYTVNLITPILCWAQSIISAEYKTGYISGTGPISVSLVVLYLTQPSPPNLGPTGFCYGVVSYEARQTLWPFFDLLSDLIWVPLIPDSSTILSSNYQQRHLVAKQEETWREMSVNFASQVSLSYSAGVFNVP
jgi:hypothetical protein